MMTAGSDFNGDGGRGRGGSVEYGRRHEDGPMPKDDTVMIVREHEIP